MLDSKSRQEKNYEITKGYIELIDRYNWDFMVTFTSGEYLTINRVISKMSKFSNYLLEQQGEAFKIFWVAEKHLSGSYHIHALIIVKDAKQSIIKRAWNRFSGTYEKTNNRCEIKPYEKGRGGNIYTVKNIMQEEVEFDFVL
jgi:hypothetical protein